MQIPTSKSYIPNRNCACIIRLKSKIQEIRNPERCYIYIAPIRPRHGPDTAPTRPRHGPDTAPTRPRHDPDTAPTRPRHGPDTAPTRPRHDPDTAPTRPHTWIDIAVIGANFWAHTCSVSADASRFQGEPSDSLEEASLQPIYQLLRPAWAACA